MEEQFGRDSLNQSETHQIVAKKSFLNRSKMCEKEKETLMWSTPSQMLVPKAVMFKQNL
jgi:hypothetical protein